MGKNLVNAVKLPSSNKFIRWPNETINERNLSCLLIEAHSKGLSGKQKIISCERVRNPKVNWNEMSNPDDSCYIDKKIILSYEQLSNLYGNLGRGDIEDYFQS